MELSVDKEKVQGLSLGAFYSEEEPEKRMASEVERKQYFLKAKMKNMFQGRGSSNQLY